MISRIWNQSESLIEGSLRLALTVPLLTPGQLLMEKLQDGLVVKQMTTRRPWVYKQHLGNTHWRAQC